MTMPKIIALQMSRRFALVALLGSLALAALAAPAGATSMSGVKGTGVMAPGCPSDPLAADFACPTYPISFSVYSVAYGTAHPNGYYQQRTLIPGRTTTLFQGKATCLSVVGNTAVVGGVMTRPAALYGIPFVEYAVDNGLSGDLISNLGIFPAGDPDLVFLPVGFPMVCPTPGLLASVYGYLSLSSGDVQVRQQP
jgi:hypothetical protein